jgi:MFS family permease
VLLVVAGVLPGFLTASLAPRIRADFPFGASELGLAVGAFYAVCTLASSPCGHLVERIGARAAVRASAAATAACTVAIALLAGSTVGLIVPLLLGGVGNAAAAPAAGALLDQHVPAGRKGLAFGVMQAGAPLGALLAGLALPAVAIPLGWQWGYVAVGVLAMLAAAAAPATPVLHAGHGRMRPRRGLSSVHALALTAALASAAAMGLVSFLVLYGVDSGLSESAAGALLAGMSVVAVLSRVVLGAAVDRAAGDPMRTVAVMLAVSAGGHLLLLGGGPVPVVTGALVVGSAGWAWPAALTLAVVRRAPDTPARAVGVMMTGLFLGAVGGPLLVGLLAEAGSFTAAWIATATLAVLAAATLLVTGRLEAR